MNIARHTTFVLICCLTASTLFCQTYKEKYRPQFHYSAPGGWVGDPCALIKYDSVYHLFTWGHAVSKDLVHWKQLPWPMKGGDGSFDYFTGSMIVDKRNTAGFGANSMIAFYTMFNKRTKNQAQGFSVSRDYENFEFYDGNPVIDIGSTEFRDPQVFWYTPHSKWVMIVAMSLERKVRFYSSPDLKRWTLLSEFGGIGSIDGVWECPDFIELPVDGDTTRKKWLMSVAVAPNTQQYFVGDFDGVNFTPDPAIRSFLNNGKGLSGNIFEDFDDSSIRQRWTITGPAFLNAPNPAKPGAGLGSGYIDSRPAKGLTGTLKSRPFVITSSAINFLIAGGNYKDSTCINLIVKDKIVRTTTGMGSSVLKWRGWDVHELIGKTACIQIVDTHESTEGFIAVDHIMFSNVLYNHGREHALWSDWGCDYYAAKSCRDFDSKNSAVTWLGWMNNWEYAGDLPTWGGGNNRGLESISRKLTLVNYPEGLRLIQQPVPQMEVLRSQPAEVHNRKLQTGASDLTEFSPLTNSYEVEAVFNTTSRHPFGLNLCVGSGRKLAVRFDPQTSSLQVDRTNCTDYRDSGNFSRKFPRILHAPVEQVGGNIKMHIFVDRSSVEIFINDGRLALSLLTYPAEEQNGIQLFSEAGDAHLVSLRGWQLRSIWPSLAAPENKTPSPPYVQ